MSILIKDVMLNGKKSSVYIENNRISEIGKLVDSDKIIDGSDKAIVPGFVNTHTHAAMSLFKGYAEDLVLNDWLQNYIWPTEAKFTENDVYWGTKLACLEMIKSGTTCFNDMYFFMKETAKAVEDVGMRAVLSYGFIDSFDEEKRENEIKNTKDFFNFIENQRCDRIQPAVGPHAIYTVSPEGLKWANDFSQEKDCPIHFHLAETEKEIKDCVENNGKGVVKYLQDLNFLNDRVIAAHSVWLSDKEIEILAQNNVKISYNPVSNMKLGVGNIMNYHKMKDAGLTISLGTDGCASNNNLDMLENIKFASLLQKMNGNPQNLPVKEAFDMMSVNGAKSLMINAGEIKEGKLADLCLINLKELSLIPGHDFMADLIYSANGSCVDTVICNGKVIMENRKIKGEEEIITNAKKCAEELVSRKE